MKRRIFSTLIVLAAVLAVSANASAQTRKTAKITDQSKYAVEPTTKEAIKLIFSNGGVLLSAHESCKSVGTSAGDKTIFDFLVGVLSFQAEAGSQNKITFEFKPENGESGERLWRIDLMFLGEKDSEPWSNGVRFLMRDKDRKMIRTSLQCTGTG